MIFTGDFHRLPPPAGHYLANIPRTLADPNATSKDDALADQGRQLLWGGPTQGVTELTDRERTRWSTRCVQGSCRMPTGNTSMASKLKAVHCQLKNGHPGSGSSLPLQIHDCGKKSSRKPLPSSRTTMLGIRSTKTEPGSTARLLEAPCDGRQLWTLHRVKHCKQQTATRRPRSGGEGTPDVMKAG